MRRARLPGLFLPDRLLTALAVLARQERRGVHGAHVTGARVTNDDGLHVSDAVHADGVALKQAVNALAVAPEAEKSARFAAAAGATR